MIVKIIKGKEVILEMEFQDSVSETVVTTCEEFCVKGKLFVIKKRRFVYIDAYTQEFHLFV